MAFKNGIIGFRENLNRSFPSTSVRSYTIPGAWIEGSPVILEIKFKLKKTQFYRFL